MIDDDWLIGLENLTKRADWLGLTVDLDTLSIVDLWGVYAFLKRIAAADGE